MKINSVFTILILGFFIFLSCEREEPSENSYLEDFISLESESDTLIINQSTKITAIAKGVNLNYLWFSDGGVFIENNGATVVYTAPDCSAGNKEISCTVKGSNRSETKKIYIYVY